MASAHVTISGDLELLAKFKQLQEVTQGSTLGKAAMTGILPIQNEAIVLAPKLTGNLARSIHSEITEQSATYAEADTGTDVEYAARQEFGFSAADSLGRHYNQPAHPYMRPAFDTKSNEATSETQTALAIIINQVGGT